MKLYLQRHAEAEAGERNDPTRSLTEQGREQVKLMGEFLVRQIGRVDLVVSSNFKRAFDTARGMADLLGCEIVETSPALDPDGKPAMAWSDVEILTGAYCPETADAHVLVVSHHPLIGELAQYLCGVKTSDEKFHHAAVMHIHGSGPGSVMEYFVPPKVVERDEATVIEAAAAVLEELLGDEIKEFREGWVTIDGAHVFIDDSGTITKGPAGLVGKSHKSVIAAKAVNAAGKKEQDIAEQTEHELSAALGMPKSPDNRPFDLQSKTVGVEIKTVISGKNDKITMSKSAIGHKNAEMKAAKLKRVYTVVADKRGAEVKYLVRQGFGSFRLGTMTSVPDTAALAKFMKLR